MKPKFKVNDIVKMKDDFHFNPASKTTSIGKIQAIHIHKVSCRKGERNILVPKFKITYTISGFSLQPGEQQLKLYKEK
ncbi:MAG: hypothetical protein GY714_19980 [Desulfobacterales bacterium]|nr:hypothetical protein [Desulfobacterales bacterium]